MYFTPYLCALFDCREPATIDQRIAVRGDAFPVSANLRGLRKFLDGRRPDLNSSKSTMDKIAGLREILALDAKNSFARYGIAMELANRGDVEEALKEFDTLLVDHPDYTAGYFMSAQTLAKAGRNAEAAERLRLGIGCAARAGNKHALSEMQGMLDELDY